MLAVGTKVKHTKDKFQGVGVVMYAYTGMKHKPATKYAIVAHKDEALKTIQHLYKQDELEEVK